MMVILCYILQYMCRINMSIAIVDMTANSTQFNWTKTQKHDILGSLFWGFIFGPIPGGRLAEIYGPRIVVTVIMLLTALFTLLTPPAAYLNYYCLLCVRFGVGLSTGAAFPAVFPVVPKWIPPKHMSQFMAHILASQLGLMLTLSCSGLLIDFWGWPCVFYISGGITTVWSFCWFYLIYDSPQQHPRIKKDEREKLEKEIAERTVRRKSPWVKILTSRPVWAFIAAYSGILFNVNTAVNYIPLYLNQILDFDIKANGVLSGLPFLATYCTAVFTCYLADRWRKRNTFSVFTIRKIFAGTLFGTSFIILLVLSVWGYIRVVAVVALILWQVFCGMSSASVLSNVMDFAPNYSGSINGISATFGGFAGYLSTKLFTAFIKNEHSFKDWQLLFWILAGANFVSFLFFVAFGSSELQEWNSESVNHDKEETEQIKLDC
ncbi:Putative inorganic phosphate cotransporter-like Protein [Tribolium castaneum]|uniref:Inorganic phosphate cotransporter-like Protein n=2 Tax=Tribolium castaneum TaxID=7070 RepID=D6WLN9_TRICA|nr:Putative inorganic phosphate cotransporter-like Protein [Tribolium castaneum]